MGRSDAELLDATRRGEREAFGALIERYQGVVCAVSYSRTGNRALSEDVAQDTFLAAWHQLDQLREASRLRAWLCGIARNLARKARVRSERESPVEDDYVSTANPFDDVAEVEAERVVQDALTRVPETYRDVLVLYYREHRSVREVARLLDITEAAALQRLSRGRQHLQQGVTQLVERSLRGHVQKSLVVGVLAAIALAPSRASAAATHAKGTSMLKLALIGAVVAAGTTTAIVRPWSHSDSQVAHVASTSGSVGAVPTPPSLAPGWKAPFVAHPAEQPKVPAGTKIVAGPGPDELPLLDRDVIEKNNVEKGPSKGAANAPVTMTLYTDALCPFCAATLGSVDQLMDEYKGKVRLVMKQMPVHKEAAMPAEALYAAEAQGKFWELHDLMSQHSDALPRTLVDQLAQQAGLDMKAFDSALDAHTFEGAVDADFNSAREMQIDGTPAYVINGRRIVGNLPIEVLRSAIDDALARAQG